MGLLTWLKDPGPRAKLLWTLYGSESIPETHDAISEIRDRGWLIDGSLNGIDLSDTYLADSDLRNASLAQVDLHSAVLENADLTSVDLHDSILRNANLRGCNLSDADLAGADLEAVDFTGAKLPNVLLDLANLRNASVTDKQLVVSHKLRGATMPNGALYDGRFSLTGDIEEAEAAGLHVDDAESMAEFYGVALSQYSDGQVWAVQHNRQTATGVLAANLAQATNQTSPKILVSSLSLWNPLSFVRLVIWAFSDSSGLRNHARNRTNRLHLQVLTATFVASSYWLPVFIWYFVFLINPRLTERVGEQMPVLGAGSVHIVTLFWTLLSVLGWRLTVSSGQRQDRAIGVAGVLALLLALYFSSGPWASIGLCTLISYLAGLIISQLIGGIPSRTMNFWLGTIFLGSVVLYGIYQALAPFIELTGIILVTPDMARLAGVSASSPGVAVVPAFVFFLFGLLVALVITFAIRYLVRTYLFIYLQQGNRRAVGICLVIGYLGGLAAILVVVLRAASIL